MSTPKLTEDNFVEQLSDYGGDFTVYQDDDGNRFYVPWEQQTCEVCRGRGYTWELDDHDEEFKDPCFDCDEQGFVNVEHFNRALDQDEYDSLHRQHFYLHERYGFIPTDIRDYWVKDGAS